MNELRCVLLLVVVLFFGACGGGTPTETSNSSPAPAGPPAPAVSPLTGFEKDLCRRLAREGFAALSIDLYGSEGEPLDLYSSTSDDDALFVLDELHQFVVSDDVGWNVDDRAGILGTDVGGRFGLIKAATRDWVRSLVIAYTPLTGDDDREHQVADYLDHLPIPVLALYGSWASTCRRAT